MSYYASIIIAVYNRVEYTRKCIDSLLSDNDRPRYELIIIDNASTDGTKEYLNELKNEVLYHNDKLVVISNSKNLGVAPAWNQGLKAATGPTIGILNNDIMVSHGWYRSLLWALEYHGLALACPFARHGELNYDLKSFAHSFCEKNLSRIWLGEYDFSAAVMNRKTYEQIGLFDEKFLIGGYEDTDYCYRLKKQALKFGIVGASFVHHFGSQTLNEFKVKGDAHAVLNRNYFVEKWQVDPSAYQTKPTAKIKKWLRQMKLSFHQM